MGFASPHDLVWAFLKIMYHMVQEMMSCYDGVNTNAWQTCAATLALNSTDPTFKDLSFNELQTLFRHVITFSLDAECISMSISIGFGITERVLYCRLSKLLSVRSVDYLRVAGSAFLVTGTVHYTGHDPALSKVYEGPCMLPAAPALYWCTTDVKVSHFVRNSYLWHVHSVCAGCCSTLGYCMPR